MKPFTLISLIVAIISLMVSVYMSGYVKGRGRGIQLCRGTHRIAYVPPDSTFVPHKFLTGEMARLNNEIIELKDSLNGNPYILPNCRQLWKGEVLGSFNMQYNECDNNRRTRHDFWIVWDGQQAVAKEGGKRFYTDWAWYDIAIAEAN